MSLFRHRCVLTESLLDDPKIISDGSCKRSTPKSRSTYPEGQIRKNFAVHVSLSVFSFQTACLHCRTASRTDLSATTPNVPVKQERRRQRRRRLDGRFIGATLFPCQQPIRISYDAFRVGCRFLISTALPPLVALRLKRTPSRPICRVDAIRAGRPLCARSRHWRFARKRMVAAFGAISVPDQNAESSDVALEPSTRCVILSRAGFGR